MEIKEILPNFDPHNFLEDYLKACGIEDIEEFLTPTGKYIENPYDYENMEEAVDLFLSIMEGENE